MLGKKIRRAVEKAVAPGAKLSYAQAGEDLALDFLVEYRPTGFYVDVGCNDPVEGSNTYRFYRKGWRGIAVDANATFARRFRRRRPRDRFVQACVSDREESVSFHMFAVDALSSISGVPIYDNPQHYRLEKVEQMTTRTLTSILDEAAAPCQFDILSIDVEGHDENVLRSLDLARYRPRVILSEYSGANAEADRFAESRMALHLAGHGYELVAVTWANAFFRLTDAG